MLSEVKSYWQNDSIVDESQTTKSDMKVLLNPPTITKAITPTGSNIAAARMSIPVSAEMDALPPSKRMADTIREQKMA